MQAPPPRSGRLRSRRCSRTSPGPPIRLRFRFSSDSSTEQGGWFLDDIQVAGALLPGPCSGSCSVLGDSDPAVQYTAGFASRSDPAASGGVYHLTEGLTQPSVRPTARLVFQGDGVDVYLSQMEVGWGDAAAACPAGTWVCTSAERGSDACDTDRVDGGCDYHSCAGGCLSWDADQHQGWLADGHPTFGTGITRDEAGTSEHQGQRDQNDQDLHHTISREAPRARSEFSITRIDDPLMAAAASLMTLKVPTRFTFMTREK